MDETPIKSTNDFSDLENKFVVDEDISIENALQLFIIFETMDAHLLSWATP